MKRLILMSLTALALMLMTACGTANTDDNASSDNQGNGSSEVVEEKEEVVVDETKEEATEDTSEEVVEEKEEEATENDVEVIREEAAYVGMQDPHSIEVTTETETIALQILDPAVEDVDFEAIEENAAVIIEYYQNEHEQNILTDIEIK